MFGSHTSGAGRRAAAAAVAAASALTVLTSAGPASASTAQARVGGSQVVCTSPQPGLASRLAQDIAGAVRDRRDSPALAVYDRRTGSRCEFRADARYDSASIVKVSVLAALLRKAQEEHRELTPREVRSTTAMITRSDNAATSTLWRRIGRDRFAQFLSLAGMRDTAPGRKASWGLTQVTARDQVKLLRLLTAPNPVLTPASRAYALGLMNRVVPSQRWGVPAGAPGSATVHVKNGWLPRSTGAWRVHSVGAFTHGGNDYGIAVLSQGNRTMRYGIATIQDVAEAVHRDLGRR
ncbi:serine hydrolase [Streptomyces sp. WMMB 322]|uniref:serine hydrolase n=1 Tax=Streptomyces sp. WMMB 322 TaxID=1286821 RepID=UPI0006E334BC|nr:serine hydrolase [Streptomyces sp. WMMB 322]SCK18238.1 Beta-lactamase class A [Streptomyces sp. WMMB 322]